MVRRVRWWAWGAVAIWAAFLIGGHFHQSVPKALSPTQFATQAESQGVLVRSKTPGTPLGGTPAPGFSLTDQFGRSVTLQQFRGKVVVLAFINSQGTTISPIAAEVYRQAQTQLGAADKRVQFLAVDANPLANTVADVRQWSVKQGLLHRWLFVTGSVSQLQSVWHHYFITVLVDKGSVSHTPAMYVIDPQGREQTLFMSVNQKNSVAIQAKRLVAAIRPLLAVH